MLRYFTVQAGHCRHSSRVCCMHFRALLTLYMLVCHCTCKSSVVSCASWSLDVHDFTAVASSRGVGVHDVTAVACSSSVVALQHDGLQQEEADAVAALLAAASGLSSEDMNASTPYPSGPSLHHPCIQAPYLQCPTHERTQVIQQWHGQMQCCQMVCHWLCC